MLSDACSTFLDDFARAAVQLAQTVDWYLSSNYEAVYGDELIALRQACARVHEAPYDDEARVNLLWLTGEVMRSYDA